MSFPDIFEDVMSTQDSKSEKTEVRMTIIRGGKPIDVEAISMEKPDQVIAESTKIRDMARIQYPPANRCIYCGGRPQQGAHRPIWPEWNVRDPSSVLPRVRQEDQRL